MLHPERHKALHASLPLLPSLSPQSSGSVRRLRKLKLSLSAEPQSGQSAQHNTDHYRSSKMYASTTVHLKAPCHQNSDPLCPPCDTDCVHGQLSLLAIATLHVAEVEPAESELAESELAESELAESELAEAERC